MLVKYEVHNHTFCSYMDILSQGFVSRNNLFAIENVLIMVY